VSDPKRRRADRRPPVSRVTVEVACNDEGGRFAGIAEGLCFAARGERLSLDLSGGAAPRFKELPDGAIYIYRRRCIIHASREYFGNWCWNAYVVDLPIAAWMLHHSIKTGKFSMDAADGNHACRLSDALDEGASLGEVTLYLSLFGADRQSP
jgi:hypothetical protein